MQTGAVSRPLLDWQEYSAGNHQGQVYAFSQVSFTGAVPEARLDSLNQAYLQLLIALRSFRPPDLLYSTGAV